MLILSAGISVGMKIVFGMYSVLGLMTLFIPFTVGILSAMSLTRSGNTATVILSSVHQSFCLSISWLQWETAL